MQSIKLFQPQKHIKLPSFAALYFGRVRYRAISNPKHTLELSDCCRYNRSLMNAPFSATAGREPLVKQLCACAVLSCVSLPRGDSSHKKHSWFPRQIIKTPFLFALPSLRDHKCSKITHREHHTLVFHNGASNCLFFPSFVSSYLERNSASVFM